MLPSEYHKVSLTRPACTNLHTGKVYVHRFYSGSFAEEVT